MRCFVLSLFRSQRSQVAPRALAGVRRGSLSRAPSAAPAPSLAPHLQEGSPQGAEWRRCEAAIACFAPPLAFLSERDRLGGVRAYRAVQSVLGLSEWETLTWTHMRLSAHASLPSSLSSFFHPAIRHHQTFGSRGRPGLLRRLLPRGLSQPAASFIAYFSQGIHHIR